MLVFKLWLKYKTRGGLLYRLFDVVQVTVCTVSELSSERRHNKSIHPSVSKATQPCSSPRAAGPCPALDVWSWGAPRTDWSITEQHKDKQPHVKNECNHWLKQIILDCQKQGPLVFLWAANTEKDRLKFLFNISPNSWEEILIRPSDKFRWTNVKKCNQIFYTMFIPLPT